ncbi:MAG: hypothetical protein H7061_12630 [Bdellovibrionaceae bacterium]|nr:hypothetical protein [Bdellovibrio sp.]
MKIQYAPYSLKKKTRTNAKDGGTNQEGVLIKVSRGKAWGVADLSPHPELGDLPWQKQLIKKGPLYKRAIVLAQVDMIARRDTKSLLLNRWVKNNYLVTDYKNFDFTDPMYLGHTIKIKGDQSIEDLVKILNFISGDIKIRLDFNCSLSLTLFQVFLDALTPSALKHIEYIEDPTAFNLVHWKMWNKIVPLAWDQQKARAPFLINAADYKIIKVTREPEPGLKWNLLSTFKHYTLTSAMDHPVGLAHGLRIAQKLAKNESGFLTLDLYETTPFHRYFIQKNNELNFSNEALLDAGIGMTEELDKLRWTDGAL